MRQVRQFFSAVFVVSAFGAAALLPAVSAALAKTANQPKAANGVAVLVNGAAVTNSDIAKRVAFLKLQHRSGNLSQIAREQLIDETLRRQEITKRGIGVSAAEVDKAYAGFAASNKLTVSQLDQLMTEAGVTPAHFKAYIRDQMSWGRLVSARFQAESTVTPQEAVQRMIKAGGKKPSLNEYLLNQVILVVPAKSRGNIGKRMAEANAIRAKINGCDNIYGAAQGVPGVAVRSLGRFLEPQIPAEWEAAVRATPANKPTRAQQTKRGVEFLVVCSVQKVSDDRVAQLVYSMQDSQKSGERGAALEQKYMKELRSAATIRTP